MDSNTINQKLETLHEDAKKDFKRIGKAMARSIFRKIQPSDFEYAYLPISAEQGKAVRQLVIKNNCKNIVEFGTSFGISTIYLADAAQQIGGKVITTEILESKAVIAKQNLKDVNLQNYVELRTGDAMLTLKKMQNPIDFLLLDGWKDLYLPLLKMLEPYFHVGTLIYADNIDMVDAQKYAAYMLSEKSSYSSRFVDNDKAMLSQVA